MNAGVEEKGMCSKRRVVFPTDRGGTAKERGIFRSGEWGGDVTFKT